MIVISDEVYEKVTYDDTRHFCLTTVSGVRECILVVGAFSNLRHDGFSGGLMFMDLKN